MAKKAREKGENGLKLGSASSQAAIPILVEKEAVDPSLAILFASSVGLSALLSLWIQSGSDGVAKIYKGWTC